MSKVFEIISKYTAGEKTLEETNAELKKMKAGFYLDPNKNVLTEEEKRATTIGCYPDQANGYGLLDTGTGTLDKVVVNPEKMELAHAVNEVNTDGTTNMYAMCIVKGKTYEVKGRKLVEC